MLQLRGDLVPLVYLGDLLHIGSSADLSGECVVIITDAGDGTRLGSSSTNCAATSRS